MNKVVLSANSSWYLYNFRSATISELLNRNYSVVCISPKDDHSILLENLGAEWIDIKLNSNGINPISDVIFLFKLFNQYKKIKPVAVFNFTIKNNIYGAIAGYFAGIKTFSNITGLGTVFINRSFISIIVKMLYKFSQSKPERVFCQNEEDLNILQSNNLVPSERLILLPGSGVNINKFLPNLDYLNGSEGKLRFLFAGRMLKDKGILELVNSFKKINQSEILCELWLLGFADTKNTSSISLAEITSWSQIPGIKWYGSTNQVEDFLSQVDVAILPSYREGMPRFLLEAGAMQIPSITTDVPGCRNIILHKFNGLICKPRSENSLIEAITQMLKMSKNKRLNMGINARNLVLEKYDERIVIEKTLQFLNDNKDG